MEGGGGKEGGGRGGGGGGAMPPRTGGKKRKTGKGCRGLDNSYKSVVYWGGSRRMIRTLGSQKKSGGESASKRKGEKVPDTNRRGPWPALLTPGTENKHVVDGGKK